MRILIVKTSSLGDLIYTLPAVTDAVRAHPKLEIDWLAEKPFAEIPAWHPAVDRVIQCQLRRWRRHPLQARSSGEWPRFLAQLRERQYDRVIDAQGLMKSAWIARKARGPVAGADRRSCREPLAARFYRYRYPVPLRADTHAIDRNRNLFAQALDYPVPTCEARSGLERSRFPETGHPHPYVLLLHGTTWPTKLWPEARWIELGCWIRAQGYDPLLPWGSAEEHERARRIAAAGGGTVMARQNLGQMASWLAHALAFVGGDTGLCHLGAALGTPGVTLYGPTPPNLAGAIGANQTHLNSTDAMTIDRKRPTTVAVTRVQAALAPWLQTEPGTASA